MNKGFTLIELIAAILVLAILLIVAIPKVKTVKDSAKQEAYILSANELIRASIKYTATSMDFSQVSVTDTKLQYEKNTPSDGYVQTNNKGETRIWVIFDRYCITKSYCEEDVTISDYNAMEGCDFKIAEDYCIN